MKAWKDPYMWNNVCVNMFACLCVTRAVCNFEPERYMYASCVISARYRPVRTLIEILLTVASVITFIDQVRKSYCVKLRRLFICTNLIENLLLNMYISKCSFTYMCMLCDKSTWKTISVRSSDATLIFLVYVKKSSSYGQKSLSRLDLEEKKE